MSAIGRQAKWPRWEPTRAFVLIHLWACGIISRLNLGVAMTEPKFPSLYRAALQHEHLSGQCADPKMRKAHIESSMWFEAISNVLSDPENAWMLEGRPPPRHLRLVSNEEV